MASGTAGDSMWQCSGCKQWIPYNQSHVCGSYQYPQQQYYTYQSHIDPIVLERIAKALEAIASQLTKRAVDLRESAASEGESTPEVNLVGGADTTPPANH